MSTSDPLRAQSAVARIRDAIMRGEFRGGAPLRQTELARRLGISRIPVREALRQLEAEGFVVLHPRRGAVVATLDADVAAELAEICEMLETHALRKAILNITEADIQAACEALNKLEVVTDVVEWIDLNWQFHSALYRASGRPKLIEMAGALRNSAASYMHSLTSNPDWRKAANQQHRAILEACKRRDVEGAVEALRRHVNSALNTIQSGIQVKSVNALACYDGHSSDTPVVA